LPPPGLDLDRRTRRAWRRGPRIFSGASARRSAVMKEDWTAITAKTLEHYNESAAQFWERTRDHDVKQNIDALLRHIHAPKPLRILDLGCGPGRDLVAFKSM